MEGTTYNYVAEHEAATKRLNDLMAEYMAVKKAEREVRFVGKGLKLSLNFLNTLECLC